MKKAIGIDLGTTNSVVAFKTRDVEILRNAENEELTRSCVALRNEQILVGKTAFALLPTNPENTVLSVKRLMGGAISDESVQQMRESSYYRFSIAPLTGGTADAVAVALGGRQYTPEQISAEILKKIKLDAEARLGDEVTHAVITVPAYFTEKQKNATRLAAQYADLKVLRLLAEPTAAAMAFGVDSMQAGELKTVVVYDFGGGTFDLSVLNIADRQYIEMGAGGDRWLGGDNIDQALQAFIFQRVEQEYGIRDLTAAINQLPDKKRNKALGVVRRESEAVKIQLSGAASANLLIEDVLEDQEGNVIDVDVTITRAEFEQLIRPIVARTVTLTEELLAQLHFTPDLIDSFLLVGGSACIPLVKQLMSDRFGADKVRVGKKPMLAIAEGAAMLAQAMGETYECPNCAKPVPQAATKCPHCGYDVDTEVKQRGVADVALTSKHDLFIRIADATASGGFTLDRLIEKQTSLPASTARTYRSTANRQRLLKVEVLSNVEGGKTERQTFGFATVDDHRPAGSEYVFDFTLSADENLTCQVYPKGYSNQAKPVNLGRGQKDEAALTEVERRIADFNAGSHDATQAEKFADDLVGVLRIAEAIERDKPLDPRWAEVSYKVGEVMVGEAADADQLVIRAMAIINHGHLLDAPTLSRFRLLVAQARSNGYEATEARQELEPLVDEYWWIDRLDDLRYAGQHAADEGKSVGAQLLARYQEALARFKQDDFEEGLQILLDSNELIQDNWPNRSQGRVGTDLGKA